MHCGRWKRRQSEQGRRRAGQQNLTRMIRTHRPYLRTLNLSLPPAWMKEHPLTNEDLDQERQYLKDAGFRLNIS